MITKIIFALALTLLFVSGSIAQADDISCPEGQEARTFGDGNNANEVCVPSGSGMVESPSDNAGGGCNDSDDDGNCD